MNLASYLRDATAPEARQAGRLMRLLGERLEDGRVIALGLDLEREATTLAATAPAQAEPAFETHTPRGVIEAVAHVTGERVQDIRSTAVRNRRTTTARRVACYVLRQKLGLGYSEIGRQLGGMDHSSVMVACRAVADSAHLLLLVARVEESLR